MELCICNLSRRMDAGIGSAEAMISIRAIIRPAEITETPAENISLITGILCFPL